MIADLWTHLNSEDGVQGRSIYPADQAPNRAYHQRRTPSGLGKSHRLFSLVQFEDSISVSLHLLVDWFTIVSCTFLVLVENLQFFPEVLPFLFYLFPQGGVEVLVQEVVHVIKLLMQLYQFGIPSPVFVLPETEFKIHAVKLQKKVHPYSA